MSWIDFIVIAAAAYGIIRGIMKGFVLEISSFAGVFMAIFIARLFYTGFSESVREWFDLDLRYAKPAAFAAIFLAVTLLCHLIAVVITKLLKIIALGWLNRMAGAAFGLLKMLIILSIVFNVMQSFGDKTTLFPQEATEKSMFFSPVKTIASVFMPFISEV